MISRLWLINFLEQFFGLLVDAFGYPEIDDNNMITLFPLCCSILYTHLGNVQSSRGLAICWNIDLIDYNYDHLHVAPNSGDYLFCSQYSLTYCKIHLAHNIMPLFTVTCVILDLKFYHQVSIFSLISRLIMNYSWLQNDQHTIYEVVDRAQYL